MFVIRHGSSFSFPSAPDRSLEDSATVLGREHGGCGGETSREDSAMVVARESSQPWLWVRRK